MKKLVQVTEVENEGMVKLMGKRVTFFCLNYIYVGELIGVNDTCVLLSNPAIVYDRLDEEFSFNFDPCPYTEGVFNVDGLSIDWGNRTYCNPPHSKLKEWCRKAYLESLKGKLVVMLIPSRTDTIAWHDYIMKADEIRFIKGRLKFGGSKNSAPFPSAVIVFNGEVK